MPRRMLVVIAACSLAYPVAANAQSLTDRFSVYATFSPTHLNGLSDYQQQGSTWLYAPGFGASVRLHNFSDGFVALDFRGSTHAGTPGFDTAFASVKFGAPAVRRLHFYGQLGAGYAAVRDFKNVSSIPAVSVQSVQRTYHPALTAVAGLDYKINRHLDVRVVDAGIVLGVDGGIPDGGGSAAALFPLSTGLAFRF